MSHLYQKSWSIYEQKIGILNKNPLLSTVLLVYLNTHCWISSTEMKQKGFKDTVSFFWPGILGRKVGNEMSLHSVYEKYFRTLEPWFIIFFGDLYFLTNFSISHSAAFGETFLCYCCIDCSFTWKISSFLLPPYPVMLSNIQ